MLKNMSMAILMASTSFVNGGEPPIPYREEADNRGKRGNACRPQPNRFFNPPKCEGNLECMTPPKVDLKGCYLPQPILEENEQCTDSVECMGDMECYRFDLDSAKRVKGYAYSNHIKYSGRWEKRCAQNGSTTITTAFGKTLYRIRTDYQTTRTEEQTTREIEEENAKYDPNQKPTTYERNGEAISEYANTLVATPEDESADTISRTAQDEQTPEPPSFRTRDPTIKKIRNHNLEATKKGDPKNSVSV